jgi:hypothetical protein
MLWTTGAITAGEAPLSPAELKRAVKLDRQKCWRCHKPHDPRSYARDEWNEWMTKMSRKARLKPSEDTLLRRYFEQTRGEPEPVK